jgi:hypothetical protein
MFIVQATDILSLCYLLLLAMAEKPKTEVHADNILPPSVLPESVVLALEIGEYHSPGNQECGYGSMTRGQVIELCEKIDEK